MFQNIIVEEMKKTHFVFNNFFFSENRAVYEIRLDKYCTAGQVTDENTADVHCMLDI